MRWLFWWRPPCLTQRVIVNFTHRSDEALRGVLWSVRGPWLTLKDVEALKANVPPTKMDGDTVIHRAQVAYLQVLP